MQIDFWVRAAFCSLAMLAGGCQPEEGPYLMWEEYQAPGGVERHTGSGCADVNTSSGSGFGSAGGANASETLPAYSIDYLGDGESVTVTIKDGPGQVLDSGRYVESFLSQRQTDELRGDFANGYVRLKLWGSNICEELRVPPGD